MPLIKKLCRWYLLGCLIGPAMLLEAKDKLTVYTALEPDQLEEYIAAFNQDVPDIALEIFRKSNGELTAKLLAEKANSRADVIWGVAASSLIHLADEGILQPYAPKGLESIAKQFRDPAPTPAWVGIDVWMSAFCINTVRLKELNLPKPKGWLDLIDPKYKGQIVMPDPSASGTGYLSVSYLMQNVGSQWAWAYLDKLDANVSHYTTSGSKPCKLAGSGEAAIGISFGFPGEKLRKMGYPIEVVLPQERSGWDLEANALMAKTKKPAIAKKFLDWAISAKAMKLYGRNFPIVSRLGDGGNGGSLEDGMKQLGNNDLKVAATQREVILKQWAGRYGHRAE